jgi:hypothetical protein
MKSKNISRIVADLVAIDRNYAIDVQVSVGYKISTKRLFVYKIEFDTQWEGNIIFAERLSGKEIYRTFHLSDINFIVNDVNGVLIRIKPDILPYETNIEMLQWG